MKTIDSLIGFCDRVATPRMTDAQIKIIEALHPYPKGLMIATKMLPIPGTSSLAHLEENVAAARLKLTSEEWKAIAALRG